MNNPVIANIEKKLEEILKTRAEVEKGLKDINDRIEMVKKELNFRLESKNKLEKDLFYVVGQENALKQLLDEPNVEEVGLIEVEKPVVQVTRKEAETDEILKEGIEVQFGKKSTLDTNKDNSDKKGISDEKMKCDEEEMDE